MEFLAHLTIDKSFAAGTVTAYKCALTLPLRLAGIELNVWQSKDLIRAAFLRNHRTVKRIPSWSLDKVLTLLKTPKFENSPEPFDLLRKTLFLIALASGNRASELANLDPTSMRTTESSITIAVRPGFLFKNQRQGRNPPNIIIRKFQEDEKICPVTWLKKYQRLTNNKVKLFTNTRTKRPLTAGSIASCLCSLIDEADPGKFPRGHDLRKFSTSLAWVRGVPTEEICKAAFWRSSTTFVRTYLMPEIEDVPCTALR